MDTQRDGSAEVERSDVESTPELARLAERAEIGIVGIARTGELTEVNAGFTALTGYERTAIAGASVDEVFPGGDVASLVAELLDRTAAGEPAVVSGVVPLARESAGVVPCELRLRPLGADDEGFVGVVRRVTAHGDVTQSVAVAPWAQSFFSLAEAIPDGVIVLDTESNVTYANPAVETILGHRPESLVGGSKLDIIPPRLRESHLAAIDRYLETGERNIDWSYVELPGQHADGHEVPLGISFNDFTMDGERYFVGLFRDITPRKTAEAEAVRRLDQQAAIARLGRHALETTSETALLSEAVTVLAEMLDTDIGTVLELDGASEVLTLRAATAPIDELVDSARIPAAAGETQAGYTLDSGGPVVVADTETETRFDVPERMAERGVRSGLSVTVGSSEDPWGVLAAFDTEPREFTEADTHAIESVANVLASAIDRYERIRQIEDQRGQLNAITQVYRVVQDIQQAVVSQSTREEIERTVCDRFVELDTYEFAWVGTAELPDRTLTPTTYAGNEGGYLDEVTVQLRDGEQSRLGGEAIRSGRTQIVSDVATDDRFAPWREAALSCGFHSVAAVPLTYRQTTFGLLGVYAGEPNAFVPGVSDVFDTLGQLTGHAIMSATQRQALHSDLVTEVELQIDGIGDLFDFDVPFSGRLRFDRMIPVSGGQFLMYASLPTDDVDTLASADVVESVSRLDEDGGESRVEITWNDPPISTLVSAFGGRIRGGVLDESSVVTTVEFPQTVEVNAVVEQLESSYPALRVSLQRRATLEPAGTDADDALSPLTERQRDALEAAYFGGYFEWPRERSAADLADAMGIADPTFHQHLRSAERQAFSRLLDDTGQKR